MVFIKIDMLLTSYVYALGYYTRTGRSFYTNTIPSIILGCIVFIRLGKSDRIKSERVLTKRYLLSPGAFYFLLLIGNYPTSE